MAVSLLCFSRAAHIALPHSTKSDEIRQHRRTEFAMASLGIGRHNVVIRDPRVTEF